MIILKTLDEIKEIKKANQIIARLYSEILPKYIKAGVSTLELNNIIEDYIRREGAIPGTIGVGGPMNPYPSGSCISVNEAVVHGIPK
ncbi:MAG: M24 family metallopeptidase, partial [Fusobacteriaceae bacterium]